MGRKQRKIKQKAVRRRKSKKFGLFSRIGLALFTFLGILAFVYFPFLKPNISRIASQDTLQLGTFYTPAITTKPATPPLNQEACNHDNGLPAQINKGIPVTEVTCSCPAWLITCENKKCKEYSTYTGKHYSDCSNQINVPPPGPGPLFDSFCSDPVLAPTDGTFCIGKPVIYLYPTSPQFIDVRVVTSGEIVVSDPPYPYGGWKQVFAKPNGELTYKEKQYKELFYESSVKEFGKPQAGITIPLSELEEKLSGAVTQLGLIEPEKEEFLEWWIPKLKALDAPYILFSILTPEEKEKIDKVFYDPEPDTRIEFIAYFKPLHKPFTGKALVLPTKPPERIGFTAVEWGGVIDPY